VLARVEHVEATDPGRDPDKQVNEDSALVADTPLGMLAVVLSWAPLAQLFRFH
jgi:hypothetical protein